MEKITDKVPEWTWAANGHDHPSRDAHSSVILSATNKALGKLQQENNDMKQIIEKAKYFFESILCLCNEGIEFDTRSNIYAIMEEATNGYSLCNIKN